MAGREEEKCRDTIDNRGRAISARQLREREMIEADTLAGKEDVISIYKRKFDLLEDNDYAINEQDKNMEKCVTLGCERRTAEMHMDSKSID